MLGALSTSSTHSLAGCISSSTNTLTGTLGRLSIISSNTRSSDVTSATFPPGVSMVPRNTSMPPVVMPGGRSAPSVKVTSPSTSAIVRIETQEALADTTCPGSYADTSTSLFDGSNTKTMGCVGEHVVVFTIVPFFSIRAELRRLGEPCNGCNVEEISLAHRVPVAADDRQ